MERTKYRVCGFCGRKTYKKVGWAGVICGACWRKNTKTVVTKNKYKYWG